MHNCTSQQQVPGKMSSPQLLVPCLESNPFTRTFHPLPCLMQLKKQKKRLLVSKLCSCNFGKQHFHTDTLIVLYTHLEVFLNRFCSSTVYSKFHLFVLHNKLLSGYCYFPPYVQDKCELFTLKLCQHSHEKGN